MLRPAAPGQLYLAMRGACAFAMALVLTYELAYHTVVVGLTPFELVLVGVVLESMTLLFEIPTGIVADLYGRRLSVIIGVTLIGCGFLVEALIPSFAIVLLAQVLWGLGFTFYSGAETAWITDEVGPEQAHPILLRATQVTQGLSIAGTFLGAALSTISVPLPIIAGAILLLLVGGCLWLTMPETGFQPTPRDQQQRVSEHLLRPFWESMRIIRVHPLLWIMLLLGAVIGLSVGGFDRLYTPHLLEYRSFPAADQISPTTWLGVLNGIIAIGSLAGTEYIRRRYRTTDQAVIIKLLTTLYGGMLVGSFVFALADVLTLAVIGFCLSQTLRTISRPILLLWINQNAEKQTRATTISAYWQANAFGQIVGSPFIGWLGGAMSLRVALTVGTALYALTIPLLLIARRRWRGMQR